MAFYRDERRLGNVYLIDTLQFNMRAITTVFCYSDGIKSVLMDIGTSDNIDAVFNSLLSQGIALESLAGITLSHYHFDHGGGCAELWKRMRPINKDFRIYTNSITKNLLQDAAGHLKGAGTTFGSFVGTMDYIPDEAFCIVGMDDYLPVEFSTGERIKLVYTPGHTADHCSPCVVFGDRTPFMFAGEAAGTLYTSDRLLSTPTSMPPNFKYDDYMSSIDKIRNMNPEAIGFCHFGMIAGADDIEFLFNDHIDFMKNFRSQIIKAFNENPSTSHVLAETGYLWKDRIDSAFAGIKGNELFFGNLRLALTFGVMVDLGFRNPKYESKTE
jgi:glyoxylase-like metal-dependent hydrolase (beta-lactamase superfamily II)